MLLAYIHAPCPGKVDVSVGLVILVLLPVAAGTLIAAGRQPSV